MQGGPAWGIAYRGARGMSGNSEVTEGWTLAADQANLTAMLPGGVPMHFRLIPAGSFRMGARGYDSREEPVHSVKIVQDFYLGTFPVTQEQFAAFASDHKNDFHGRKGNPVESVDWLQATAFCDWLTKSGELPPGYMAHLPSEIQWEYACRADTDTEYCNGDGEAALQKVGWFNANSQRNTRPVGGRSPNDWGLYDMHGNVWEWCSDVWREGEYRDRRDGHEYEARADEVRGGGNTSDRKTDRVLRGGSWFDSAGYCRSAYRYWYWAGFRYRCFGFRVCLLPGPDPGQPDRPNPTRARRLKPQVQ